MWQLVKYPRFTSQYQVVEDYDHFPLYLEISTRMLTEGARPDKIPKLYLGSPVETEFHTFRLQRSSEAPSEIFWADKCRNKTVSKEFTYYSGIKGMSALSKKDFAERLKHANQ